MPVVSLVVETSVGCMKASFTKVLDMQHSNQRQTALALSVAINTAKAKLRNQDILRANVLEDIVE